MMKTPLFDVHVQLGARMIDFAGWQMPVQYSGILQEHRTVRQSAGIFDLSHMGEFLIAGPDAAQNLQRLTTNDVFKLQPGQAHYTFICLENGGIVDDVILYRIDHDQYYMVVNAANIEKDRLYLRERLQGRAVLTDRSSETALIAVQGPSSPKIIASLTSFDVDQLAPFHAARTDVAGIDVLLSRTGYTGEDGFELYAHAGDAVRLWERLMEAGGAHEMVPVGLGARDTLRLEARLPLYGNELTEERSPVAAGLSFAVKWDKGPFIGREALWTEKEEGSKERLIGFIMDERGVPRNGYPIVVDGRQIGVVTSGSFAPSLEKEIGLGYVASDFAAAGTLIGIDIRGKVKQAHIVKGRFLPLRS